MSDLSRREKSMDDAKVTELVLQDSKGDSDRLRDLFDYLAQEINKSAPKRRSALLQRLLGLIIRPLGVTWKSVAATFGWVADRLLDSDQRVANAEETLASAQVKRSQAKVIEAEGEAKAEKTLAEAEALRTETSLKLLRELKELGLDWQAIVTENGEFKIAVSRQPRIEEAFNPRRPR
jgi:hypothetical protein